MPQIPAAVVAVAVTLGGGLLGCSTSSTARPASPAGQPYKWSCAVTPYASFGAGGAGQP
ncbi:MAG: hypothetical protein ACLP70_22380 [Streptosporangiaceae bacterium]